MEDTRDILFFDGTCALCARIVKFVLEHERGARTLRFAPLEGRTAGVLRDRYPDIMADDTIICVSLAANDSVVFYKHSEAVSQVLRLMGGPWRTLGRVIHWVPRPIRDSAYRLVARSRHRMFGRDTSCLIPIRSISNRFDP